jgi:hypothetical protein
VEMRSPPTQCNFAPLLAQNPPDLSCAAGDTLSSRFSETFETDPTTRWTLSTTMIYAGNAAIPWEWTNNTTLPNARAGKAMLAPNQVDLAASCNFGVGDVSRATALTSPPITLTAATSRTLVFEHYIASEPEYDGGNVKIRVNGGTWQTIASGHFSFNAYNTVLTAAQNTDPLAGQPAFSGTDGGSLQGSWGESRVNLATYANTGDVIQIRFEFGADGCAGSKGWYVDDVRVMACESPATATATATSTATPTQTPTVTATPSNTPTATLTSTPTQTPAATPSNTPTATATSTPTQTLTATAMPSNTPTQIPTAMATPSNTLTATSAPTQTPRPSSTQSISTLSHHAFVPLVVR